MSEEFKIPPDLSVFESQLGSIAVPESRLDRDEVLYQAGWAAAMAASDSSTQPKGILVGKNWAWPTATGAFATLATVLALALFQQSSDFDNESIFGAVATNHSDAESKGVESKGAGMDGRLLTSDAVVNNDDALGHFETSVRGRRFAIDLDSDPTRLRRAIGGRFLDEEIDTDILPTIETNRGGFTNVKATSELLRELSPVPDMRQGESKQKSWFTKSWEAVL